MATISKATAKAVALRPKTAPKPKAKFATRKEMAHITAAIIKKYGKALKELAR